MLENPDIRFNKIIFCGSVIGEGFQFDQLIDRFTPPLLNEVGGRDIWPAVAESVTWGYGWAGSHGLNHPLIATRWHPELKHSDFFTEKFCQKYWLPFLMKDVEVRGGDAKSAWPVKLITRLKLRFWIAALIAYGIYTIATLVETNKIIEVIRNQFAYRAEHLCLQVDPKTASLNSALNKRPCFPGKIVFIKYWDPTDYRKASGQPP